MIRQAIHIIFLSACILLHAMSVCAAPALPEDSTPVLADSVIQVEDIQVTAIKQGLVLRSQPVAASIVGGFFAVINYRIKILALQKAAPAAASAAAAEFDDDEEEI